MMITFCPSGVTRLGSESLLVLAVILSAGELGAMMMITFCPSGVTRLGLRLSCSVCSVSSTTVGQPSVLMKNSSSSSMSSWFWSSWMSEWMLLGEETLQSPGRSYSMPQLVMMSARLGWAAGLGLGFTMTEGRSRGSGRLGMVAASLISCSSSRKEVMFSELRSNSKSMSSSRELLMLLLVVQLFPPLFSWSMASKRLSGTKSPKSSISSNPMFSILIIFYSLVGFLFLNFFCVLGHDCLGKRRHDALLKKHTRCAGVARLLHGRVVCRGGKCCGGCVVTLWC